jgi:hypothetical protein
MGNVKLAQDRLERMRSLPDWSNDICFQLSELSIAISSASSSDFGLKEAIYSLQELIQLYGQSGRLSSALAAVYGLMGRFGDAQGALSKAVNLDADGMANSVAISVHLAGTEESVK